MLTKRIIGVILLRDGRAVKSRQFGNYRDVGDPISQARIMYANGMDEICILNTQGEKGVSPLLHTLSEVSETCFIPIAAGGGIRTVDDAMTVIKCGAEKVVIRTALDIIPELAEKIGSQSVVQCADFSWLQKRFVSPLQKGAGELLIQDMDRDGMMTGYCMEMFPEEDAPYETDVPTVILGGCGNYSHMLQAFKAGMDACAAGSLWAFTDSNPIRAKKWLKNNGVNVRT